jgi:hypothetical protein
MALSGFIREVDQLPGDQRIRERISAKNGER